MPVTDTSKYRTFLTRCFYDAMSSTTSGMYLAVGRLLSWNDEGDPPSPNNATQTVDFDVWRDMLAAKQIDTANTAYVIPRRDWVSNTVYTQYDDTVVNLTSSNIYVLDTQTFPYRVYKCLWNNNGAGSTVAPSTTGNNITPVTTTDNYVWQYMYTITTDQYQFLTDAWMPVSTDNSVAVNANLNAGKLSTAVPLIVTDGGAHLNPNGSFTITINGDGNGATINATTGLSFSSNTVTDVMLSNGGIGYSVANVTIAQAGVGTQNAQTRAIIPPYPNHGYDPQIELGGAAIMLTVALQDDELNQLTTVNDYRRIFLIRNPLDATGIVANGSFYRQTFDLYLESNTGIFQVDESIYVSSNTDYPVTATVVDVIADPEPGIPALVRVTNINDKGRTTAFQVGDYISSSTVEGKTGRIQQIDPPELKPFTGSVLYIDQREAVIREPNQSEEIKLVFRFD